jgi:hypothetical protein
MMTGILIGVGVSIVLVYSAGHYLLHTWMRGI